MSENNDMVDYFTEKSSQRDTDYENRLNNQDNPSEDESVEEEEEIYINSPVTKSFVQDTPEKLPGLIGFSADDFLEIYAVVEEDLNKQSGRGRKKKLGHADSFMLVLIMLKHFDNWDRIAQLFNVNASVAQKTFRRVLNVVLPSLKENYYVAFRDSKYNESFKSFPEAFLAIDCTFQTCQKPKIPYKAASVWFSGKHGAYGIKKETGHLSNGICVFTSRQFPGSKHDFSIYKKKFYEV